MTINKEFIVDLIKKYDNYNGFENVISYIQAHWKLTNPLYPKGYTYHIFTLKLDLTNLSGTTFKPIDQITNNDIETWCTETLDTNQRLGIENAAINTIKESHEFNSMTVYYQNPDSASLGIF